MSDSKDIKKFKKELEEAEKEIFFLISQQIKTNGGKSSKELREQANTKICKFC